MPVLAKICGVTTPEAMDAAAAGGARWVGLVFWPKSPRALPLEVAAQLARRAPTGMRVVGLFVDPTDAQLEATLPHVPLDSLQLAGEETPRRLAQIKARWPLPIVKSVRVAGPADIAAANDYADTADWLLFDAKPPAGVAALPGGNGLAFDWSILPGRTIARPWMLAGGLTPRNVAEAVSLSGAQAVDVSSGVETRPGLKDPALIRAFLAACADLGLSRLAPIW